MTLNYLCSYYENNIRVFVIFDESGNPEKNLTLGEIIANN